MRRGETQRASGNGGQRGERITQRPRLRAIVMRMAAMEMDELAELVDMLDRVVQRRLPAGKQRENEKKST